VYDQLNIHKPIPLQEAFALPTVSLLVERSAIHPNPKHGNWLKIAENALLVLILQCLAHRISDHVTVERETTAWHTEHNQLQKSVN